MTDEKINKLMNAIGESTRAAVNELTKSSHRKRNQAINFIAQSLLENLEIILEANSKDIDLAREKQLPDSMIDRLMLNEVRIQDMAENLKVITEIQDPINRVTEEWIRPNGMKIQRVTVPLGVIGIIYESRPNVTADAAALCIKSGNAVILRGGSESFESNKAIHYCLQEALKLAKLNPDIVQIVPIKDRDAVGYMLSSMRNYLDVIIPRGGKSLVKRVQDEARIPVIGHLEGICHVYVHKSAEIKMAREVILNAKMRRTGICGAAETVLLDREIASDIIKSLVEDLSKVGCEVRGDNEVQSYSEIVVPSNEDDWSTEYLDAIISFRVVDDVIDAINHIERYGSGHTDSIISQDKGAADTFIKEVDSAIVMHNTSTQFADGGEFGMGAEIGIATGRIHARGPVGAMQLTSYKYVVRGNGQTRP
jgi:glutamate-5-semialdehyde dehydrogenase